MARTRMAGRVLLREEEKIDGMNKELHSWVMHANTIAKKTNKMAIHIASTPGIDITPDETEKEPDIEI